jgi:phosphoribosyl 1,2-cyclic phosphodiesterase
MILRTIASSSDGNATYVFNEDTHIIIDSGVSVKSILEKTKRTQFDAILISHEHSDHIKSAGPLGRKTKAPIYFHKDCLAGREIKFKKCDMRDLDPTQVYNIGSIQVTPFSTKHDAAYSVGFILEDKDTKFCYLTDTGSISKLMLKQITGCKSYFLECDYDEKLMDAYPGYDDYLKSRITSNFGHLSNQQCMELLGTFDLSTVKTIVFGHLSQNTNSPETLNKLIEQTFPNDKSKFYIAPLDSDVEL